MHVKIAGLTAMLVCTLSAGSHEPPKPAEARGENESVVIEATLYTAPSGVKELLGSDLDGHYTVIALKVTPRFGKHVAINRDDFQIKTDKDGEKSTPFAPSQIAGSGVLVVSQTGGGGGGGVRNNDGPIWNGYPGASGPPRRLGNDGANVGDPPAPEGAKAKVRPSGKDKVNPVLTVLKEKELPETNTDQPVSGLLYFPLEKQKPKDIELRYDLTGDKIVMRFRQGR